MKFSFLCRQFGGKVSNAHMISIKKKLFSLASTDVEADIDDFVRLFILFIFNCIIFSTSNYIIHSFIFPYMDALSTLFKFAWEMSHFIFFTKNYRIKEFKTYMDGCTIGLMVINFLLVIFYILISIILIIFCLGLILRDLH